MSTENPNFSNPEFNGIDPENLAFLQDLDSRAEQTMAPADQAVSEAEQTVLDVFGEDGALPIEKQTYSGNDQVLRDFISATHEDLHQAPDGVIPPVKDGSGFSQAQRDAAQEQLRRNGWIDENGTWHSLF